LIDVMLVLLILFMLTAPLMSSRLKLDLPETQAPATPPEALPQVMAVAITANGMVHLNEQPVSLAALEVQARALAERDPDTEVHLSVDKVVRYDKVAETMAVLQQAGLRRLAFVTASTSGAQ
jgi:biopolymer transport protein ExbD/biopolymer transport protein TolR